MSFSPIFHESWWLDAIAGPGNWGESVVCENDIVIARLHWFSETKLGFTLLTQPPLTQSLGPSFDPLILGNDSAKKFGIEKKLTEELLEKLPEHDYFQQNFSIKINNWLPWYWKGYEQTTRYTYILKNITDLDRVWDGMQSSTRRQVRKAKKRGVEIVSDLSIDLFIELHEKTFYRQNKKLPYSKNLIAQLDGACEKKGARKIFFAQDQKSNLHAAVYLVWNKDSAWYLMGGGDPIYRDSGAYSLALWEAIKFASTVTKSFDFEGSMIEPIERFFRGFGGFPTPYFQVKKTNNRLLSFAQQGRKIIMSPNRN